MKLRNTPLILSRTLLFIGLCLAAGSAFGKPKYQVLFRFQGGAHGYTPDQLIADGAGNFYGATQYGGTSGSGVVFQLSPRQDGTWKETVLASFSGGMFGADVGSLVLDATGNIYGTSGFSGKAGIGLVFKLSPPTEAGTDWTETDLYSFDFWDGSQPEGLALDSAGNLYGATVGGGRGCSGFGCGTIYELSPPKSGQKHWQHRFLYYFKGVPGANGNGDGSAPFSVVFDKKGNLIGATEWGGSCQLDSCYGTVFKLQPPNGKRKNWKENVLFRFGDDVEQLLSGVVFDSKGALYGAALDEVYQLTLLNGVWVQSTLNSGAYLYGPPIVDSSGNVYGTTLGGGTDGLGIVYKLTPPHFAQTVLHSFAGGQDGSGPVNGVVFGMDGALYGTTIRGGNDKCSSEGSVGCGTVFKVLP